MYNEGERGALTQDTASRDAALAFLYGFWTAAAQFDWSLLLGRVLHEVNPAAGPSREQIPKFMCTAGGSLRAAKQVLNDGDLAWLLQQNGG